MNVRWCVKVLVYLRGWISKNSNIETPMNIYKKIVFVPGQGETTWGYGFYPKKVILDPSQCRGGRVLDWVPFTAQ